MHKESMNSTMDFLSVKPHTDDQLSKELLKVETTEFLSFLYPQKYDNYVPATVHIKHRELISKHPKNVCQNSSTN